MPEMRKQTVGTLYMPFPLVKFAVSHLTGNFQSTLGVSRIKRLKGRKHSRMASES